MGGKKAVTAVIQWSELQNNEISHLHDWPFQKSKVCSIIFWVRCDITSESVFLLHHKDLGPRSPEAHYSLCLEIILCACDVDGFFGLSAYGETLWLP